MEEVWNVVVALEPKGFEALMPHVIDVIINELGTVETSSLLVQFALGIVRCQRGVLSLDGSRETAKQIALRLRSGLGLDACASQAEHSDRIASATSEERESVHELVLPLVINLTADALVNLRQDDAGVGAYRLHILVRVADDVAGLEDMANGHGAWSEEMTTYAGCVGRISKVFSSGDVVVAFADRQRFRYSPEVLEALDDPPSEPQLGDTVRLKYAEDRDKCKSLQERRSPWKTVMDHYWGQMAVVRGVGSEGDLDCRFPDGVRFSFSPMVLEVVVTLPVSSQKTTADVRAMPEMVKSDSRGGTDESTTPSFARSPASQPPQAEFESDATTLLDKIDKFRARVNEMKENANARNAFVMPTAKEAHPAQTETEEGAALASARNAAFELPPGEFQIGTASVIDRRHARRRARLTRMRETRPVVAAPAIETLDPSQHQHRNDDEAQANAAHRADVKFPKPNVAASGRTRATIPAESREKTNSFSSGDWVHHAPEYEAPPPQGYSAQVDLPPTPPPSMPSFQRRKGPAEQGDARTRVFRYQMNHHPAAALAYDAACTNQDPDLRVVTFGEVFFARDSGTSLAVTHGRDSKITLGWVRSATSSRVDHLVICQICTDEFLKQDLRSFPWPMTDGTVIECDHSFCADCCRGFLNASAEDGGRLSQTGKLTCPMPNCEHPISPEVVRDILNAHEWEQYDKALCAGLAKQFVTCPKCNNPSERIEGGEARCPYKNMAGKICGHVFCPKCARDVHHGITCKEFAEQQQLDAALSGITFVLCPQCYALCEPQRAEECRRATCPSCNFVFCSECGADNGLIHKNGNTAHETTCKFYFAETAPPETLIDFVEAYGGSCSVVEANDALERHNNDMSQALAYLMQKKNL
ncbi:hypothetical protein CTAYLR_002537 [Chrysophaeum taylorii]|uniref:RBR-type E3 ubiquitin transferase n=1 Tax=Chrysophaeum taylorii TaxID=2483200 RepID=A0AAD7UH79_9STRA|nr:hypothetical protein CTAYLR_002537 [Chrysophaeum taylorii]